MSSRLAWLEARSAGAPPALRDRVRHYVDTIPSGLDLPNALAAAAINALEVTIAADGSRSAALDLLASDALVTLALQAKAEQDPARMATFARHLRDSGARCRD